MSQQRFVHSWYTCSIRFQSGTFRKNNISLGPIFALEWQVTCACFVRAPCAGFVRAPCAGFVQAPCAGFVRALRVSAEVTSRGFLRTETLRLSTVFLHIPMVRLTAIYVGLRRRSMPSKLNRLKAFQENNPKFQFFVKQ